MFPQHSFQVSAAIFRSLATMMLAISAATMVWASVNAETQAAIPFGKIFVVNNTFDSNTGAADDAFPGDGVCETGGNNDFCTLRAALDEIIARKNGSDGISFNIPTTDPGYSNGVWTIGLASALPDISVPMSVSGPGSAKLVVDGRSGWRVFNVTTAGIVSFSGIAIANGTIVVMQFQSGGAGIQNVNGGTINIINCVLRDNETIRSGNIGGVGRGGAIFNAGSGRVNISNSTLRSNVAVYGGGIYNANGTVTVSNSTFDHNRGDQGGGIYNDNGTITIIGSTFYNNIATSAGGGIVNSGTISVINISNSTFYANIASSLFQGQGGAIYGVGTINLSNSTLTANFSSYAGSGVVAVGGTVNVKSTIIALNYGGHSDAGEAPDVFGHFTSKGFNLIGRKDGSTGFGAATDKKGTIASPLEPKLDSKGLRSNGGPTQTVALLVGSPAIDKGSSVTIPGTTLTTDQRGTGHPRTVDKSDVGNAVGGDGTDIGAFELP